MKHFESFMASKLQDYVAYRKALGYAHKGIKPSLLAFDRYLIDQNAGWDQLQPAFFLQLRAKISNHPNTVNTILSGIRSFFQFLVRQDICEDNPLKDIPPLPERYFVPFVFSPAQTDLLLQAVCKTIRKSEKHFLFDMAIYLTIVMLARCGMRINEPLRLRRYHYRGDEGSVYIQKKRLRTSPFVNNLQQRIRITHPFHPLFNQEFDLVAYRKSWRREYIDCHDHDRHLISIPLDWTDAAAQDPFVVLAAGRAYFRCEDLVALAELIARFSG